MKKQKIGSIRARIRYLRDNIMSAGPMASLGVLFGVILLLSIVAGAVFAVTRIGPGDEPPGFVDAFWDSLNHAMLMGLYEKSWAYRLLMFGVALCGLILYFALLGVTFTSIDTKLAELRRGRSNVIERDHTIVLNWSPAIFDIIAQLVVANESRRRPRVIVLADKDKVEMEEEIKTKVPELRNTRVICRSGDPTSLDDLAIVSPYTSRSIIVVSPESDDPDAQVITSILAIVNDPRRRATPYSLVAEIRQPENARLARIVGGSELRVVLADDLLARIFVHSSRQTGLSLVYSTLLDFEGCEIYTAEQPQLVGKSFDFAVMAYAACTPIGLCDVEGRVRLNPPGATVIGEREKIVIIAEDDSTIHADSSKATINIDGLREPKPAPIAPERFLLVGWNRRGRTIAHELSRFVAPGSLLTIAANTPDIEHQVGALALPSENLAVDLRLIDATNRTELDSLDVPSYDHVLVLGYSDLLPPQQTDARTVIALLHLRRIIEESGRRISIVSEMVDNRNRALAEVARVDDFVVGNHLVSRMLAQVAENESITQIFDDLLDEAGSELYIRPITDYITANGPVNFYTVAEAARRRGEVAIGYRRVRNDSKEPFDGIVVNPVKSEALQYEAGDRIIVLAEN